MKFLKYILSVVFLMSIFSIAFSAPGYGPYTYYEGVQTMTLRNGVNSYTGCEDTYIESDTPTSNHGSENLLTVFGDSYFILMKWDLSDLNSNDIIVDAKLKVASYGEGTLLGESCAWSFKRLMRAWAETETTWEERKTSPGDSSWTTDGALSTGGWTDAFDVSGENTIFGIWADNEMEADSRTEQSIIIGASYDSLYSGYTATTEADIEDSHFCVTQFNPNVRGGGDVGEAWWLEFDITKAVKNWVYGNWANHGFKIDENLLEDEDYYLRSSDHATVALRPQLIIKFLRPVSSPSITHTKFGNSQGITSTDQ